MKKKTSFNNSTVKGCNFYNKVIAVVYIKLICHSSTAYTLGLVDEDTFISENNSEQLKMLVNKVSLLSKWK